MLLRIRHDPTRFMEPQQPQPQRFSGSDRLLHLLSQPEPASPNSNPNSLELNEADIFSTSNPQSPNRNLTPNPNPNPNPNLTSSSLIRGISERNFGILAALPDRNPSPSPNLNKVSLSFSSSAMMVPPSAKPKPKLEKVYHSSAPVSIPVVNNNRKGGTFELESDADGDMDDEDKEMAMMMPPHEIVARREARGESTPLMATFSMLEGVGRTLKGRDLRRVRNAILID